MQITFLGTGCIIPQKNRLPSSYLIENENIKILMDMGPGIFGKLYEHIKNPFALDYIILTHFHQDHIADLWPWLFAGIWAEKYFPEIKKTKIIAHNSFIDLWDNKKNETDVWLNKIENVEIIPFEDSFINTFTNLKIQALKMNHKDESLGYRMSIGGKIISFSGDTGENDNLVNLFNGADVGIIECSFSDENKVDCHLYPAAIERLLSKVTIYKMFLSHFYPGTAESESVKSIVDEFTNVKIAYDGLALDL